MKVLLALIPLLTTVTNPVFGSNMQSAATTQRSFLNQYCTGCHNERARTANLTLDTLDVSRVSDHPEIWEKVVRKLRAGLMPPAGARHPDRASADTFTVWLESELDRATGSSLAAGAPGLHRLNRTEYANAIRDLLALEIDATSLLPADDSSFGFDNMAGTLGVSPALMERYLSAAAKLSRLAIGDAAAAPVQKTFSVPADLTQNQHIEGLPLGTRGGLLVRHQLPADGEYAIQVELLRDVNGVLFGGAVAGEQLEVAVNGQRVRVFNLDTDIVKAGFVETKPLQLRIPLKAGLQNIGVAFIARNHAPTEDAFQPFQRSTITLSLSKDWTALPHVGSVTLIGPYQAAGVGDTQSRRRIFSCRPPGGAGVTGSVEKEERACAGEILSSLAGRAFRRPVREEDLEVLMDFYESGRREGDFEDGIELGLRRILASPEFVFRIQSEPQNLKPGETYRITDLELASRLSFFLWSSIPDDELLKVAAQGSLRQPAVLDQQVRRMLADDRALEFTRNFAGQWLYLRNLPSLTPALAEFPDFDDNLRQAFRKETELFFESIVREDRNVIELLTADYTFVNERLARHYNIPNIYGTHFRRVTVADEQRRGLLGHGSVLLATSYATRTSPVLRGKWILENILGTPPPNPPANVPPLKENTGKAAAAEESLSVRKRMEEHRTNPACATCHKMMDPIGFALENFDAVGMWRTRDGRALIDAAGELADGTRIDGPASLRQALVGYSEQFTRTVAEKLLTYALGRGTEYYDMPVVRSIVRDAARNDYRFSSLILGIVKSPPFQTNVKMQ